MRRVISSVNKDQCSLGEAGLFASILHRFALQEVIGGKIALTMSKIIRVEIKDGLLFPSGFIARANYTCVLYLQVPETWLEGDTLLASSEESILECLYGMSWRQGNEDGSRYHVFSLKSDILTAQEVADRIWLQHQADDRSYQYWYYHVTGDGQFQSSEQAHFNQ